MEERKERMGEAKGREGAKGGREGMECALSRCRGALRSDWFDFLPRDARSSLQHGLRLSASRLNRPVLLLVPDVDSRQRTDAPRYVLPLHPPLPLLLSFLSSNPNPIIF